MPIMIKLVPPKRKNVRVFLMVFLAVRALKRVGAWLTLLCFQSRWIYFFIGLATPCKLLVML